MNTPNRRREKVQQLAEHLSNQQASAIELREALKQPSALVRANALEAIGRQRDGSDAFVDDLVGAALDPRNATLLMGMIAVSHVAVAALLRLSSPCAVNEARRLIHAWPEADRDDLLWYLRSEALLDEADSESLQHSTG